MLTFHIHTDAFSRFGFGTAVVESVVRYLGQFNMSNKHWSWIPKTSFSRKSSSVGYSQSQARFHAVVISSIMHAMFFVMMGSRRGYWTCFSAYAVAAFSRGILTGMACFDLPPPNLFDMVGSFSKRVLRPWVPSIIGLRLWHVEYVRYFCLLFLISKFSLGFGGVVAPLVCQTAISRGFSWDKFYLGSLILSGLNTAFLALTFRPTVREFLRDRRVALSVGAARDKLSSDPDTPIDEIQIQLPTVVEKRKRSGALFPV